MDKRKESPTILIDDGFSNHVQFHALLMRLSESARTHRGGTLEDTPRIGAVSVRVVKVHPNS